MTITPYEPVELTEDMVAASSLDFPDDVAGWYLVPPGGGDLKASSLYQEKDGEIQLRLGMRGPFPSEQEASTERDRLMAIDSEGATET